MAYQSAAFAVATGLDAISYLLTGRDSRLGAGSKHCEGRSKEENDAGQRKSNHWRPGCLSSKVISLVRLAGLGCRADPSPPLSILDAVEAAMDDDRAWVGGTVSVARMHFAATMQVFAYMRTGVHAYILMRTEYIQYMRRRWPGLESALLRTGPSAAQGLRAASAPAQQHSLARYVSLNHHCPTRSSAFSRTRRSNPLSSIQALSIPTPRSLHACSTCHSVLDPYCISRSPTVIHLPYMDALPRRGPVFVDCQPRNTPERLKTCVL